MSVFHTGDLVCYIASPDALEQYAEGPAGTGVRLMLHSGQTDVGDAGRGKGRDNACIASLGAKTPHQGRSNGEITPENDENVRF